MRKLVLFLHFLLTVVYVFCLFAYVKSDGSILLTPFIAGSFIVSIVLISLLSHLAYRNGRRRNFFNAQAAAEASHFRASNSDNKKSYSSIADKADADTMEILSKWK